MSSVYQWPATWAPNVFEMRVLPNAFTFTSTYSKTTQTIDFLGERWTVRIDLAPDSDPVLGAAREAFFDRLRGPVNLISVWNLRRPIPQGTLRDTAGGNAQWKTNTGANATWQTSVPSAATWSYIGPTLFSAMAQLSNILPICTTPGTTVLAGDQIGVGQLFRAMANATADATGLLAVEVLPRARTTIPISSTIICTKPTANFMLKSPAVPIVWHPGMFDGATLELIEAY